MITVEFGKHYKVNRHKNKIAAVKITDADIIVRGRCSLLKDGTVKWNFKFPIPEYIQNELNQEYPPKKVQKLFSEMKQKKALKDSIV